MTQDESDGEGPPYPTEQRIDDETAHVVYAELGRQVERIDAVLEAFQEQDLNHTPAYDQLQDRRGRFCRMRGYLQDTAETELRDEPTNLLEMLQHSSDP